MGEINAAFVWHHIDLIKHQEARLKEVVSLRSQQTNPTQVVTHPSRPPVHVAQEYGRPNNDHY